MTASIEVGENGPYEVTGAPVVRAREVKGETGHPERWEIYAELSDGSEQVWLCRCGHSNTKPFCDGSHERVDFDGTEHAPTTSYAQRADSLGGTGVEVHDDRSICEHAGFCATRHNNVWKMVGHTDDVQVREHLTAMIDNCPSGALSYYTALGETADDALPVRVAVVENGPYFVTGVVPVKRSDAAPLETRGRMTLCRCGQSAIKPLCDGSHAKTGFADG